MAFNQRTKKLRPHAKFQLLSLKDVAVYKTMTDGQTKKGLSIIYLDPKIDFEKLNFSHKN